jgi:hypothetical protein
MDELVARYQSRTLYETTVVLLRSSTDPIKKLKRKAREDAKRVASTHAGISTYDFHLVPTSSKFRVQLIQFTRDSDFCSMVVC